MRVVIKPGVPRGRITAPPSKSMAHRLLICAGLSGGVSTVRGISDCEDVRATIDCLSALGVVCERIGNDVKVYGKAPCDMTVNSQLLCRESGSTIRFFIPIALLLGEKAEFIGAKSLMTRPMGIYRDICESRGYSFSQNESGISVCGSLSGGIYELPGDVSSQFISGLLFALPTVNTDSEIRIKKPIESVSYIKMTLSALESFGVHTDFNIDTGVIRIPRGQKYVPQDITVEGDYSGAAFIEALNYLGGEVKVDGLVEASLQGDAIYKEYFNLINKGTPTLDIGNCPDLAPILFALSAAKSGARFIGTRRLKIKESDRSEAMRAELSRLGARLDVFENEVVVLGGGISFPSEPVFGHNDHRIVMALATLMTTTGGQIIGAEAIKKSYPDFFSDLQKLGITVEKYEA